MKKLALIALVAIAVMTIPLFTPYAKAAGQPPIITNYYWEGDSGWGPRRADTVRAYDTASGELLFNVYENLIMWNYETYYDFVPVLATNVPTRVTVPLSVTGTIADKANPKGAVLTGTGGPYTVIGWFDFNVTGPNAGVLGMGDVIYLGEPSGTVRAWYVVGMIGDPTLNLERYTYTFDVNTNPNIKFVNETGQVVDSYDEADIKYSFDRGFVQDQAGSPMWMFYKPMLGVMDNSNWDPTGTVTGGTVTDLAHLIDSAVTVDAVAHTATFSLGIPFPDNAFKQILSNTWAGIVSQQFSISIGCWNGDLYTITPPHVAPDWWYTVMGVSRSPYDGTGANVGYRFAGTGPYRITTYSAATFKVIMEKNTIWWQGWPWKPLASAAQPPYQYPSNSSLDTIELDFIADWTTRKTKFLDGEVDTCYVPRANMFELLDPVTKDVPAGVNYKTIKNIVPSISMDANHFTFTIDPTSTYIYTGSFPGGIYPDFFNNTHVRKAFAYSFNTTRYTLETWFGEADYRKNWMVYGLFPDYYDDTVPGYDINAAAAATELQASVVDGHNVWTSGFTLGMAYNTGNDQRRIACEMTRDFFGNLSTYGGRVGPPFVITINEIDWPTYLTYFEAFQLPIFDIGWLADFADVDNFARPYMHSAGDFSSFQNYTADNGWGSIKDSLMDVGLLTADGPARAAVYAQLATIYYNDVPSYPITNPRGRSWRQYWVKGWYYDAIYPATYFATVWKQDNPWYDITGQTTGISDGIVNMRDISYLIVHFNAKAPAPGKALDPKWVGDYGANGGVDPYGDRICNMRDIQGAILNFNAKGGTGHP